MTRSPHRAATWALAGAIATMLGAGDASATSPAGSVASPVCPGSLGGDGFRTDVPSSGTIERRTDGGQGPYFVLFCAYGLQTNPSVPTSYDHALTLYWAESGHTSVHCAEGGRLVTIGTDQGWVYAEGRRAFASWTGPESRSAEFLPTARELVGQVSGAATLCPGARPAPVSLDITYMAPPRYARDDNRDGIVDAHDTLAEIGRASFVRIFTVRRRGANGCPSFRSYHYLWRIDGRQRALRRVGRCRWSWPFRSEGTHSARLVVQPVRRASGLPNGSGSLRFLVQDWLIVGMGDSVASGEGVPDIEGDYTSKPVRPVRWTSRRCHRSARSHQALAARTLEVSDSRTSVTFLHVACSGAGITDGLLGPYDGIEPGKAPLLAQIATVRRLIGSRDVDAVFLNIGANDIGFGQLVTFCITWASCPTRYWGASTTTMSDWSAAEMRKLPGYHDRLNSALRGAGILPVRVYQTEYPSEVTGDNLQPCTTLIDLGGNLSILVDESSWMLNSFLIPLNEYIEINQSKGWKHARDLTREFRPHGLCASQPWVVGYDQSKARQGNIAGTMHPNTLGHAAMSRWLLRSLLPLIYAGGDPAGGAILYDS